MELFLRRLWLALSSILVSYFVVVSLSNNDKVMLTLALVFGSCITLSALKE